MTTPIPITTFDDILAAMEQNPKLQAAMRQHILDQEFLQLPALVRELQQAIADLTRLVHDYIAATNARLDRLEEGQSRLEEGQAKLEEGQTQMGSRLDRLEGNVNRLMGSDYERKAARRASRLAQRRLGLPAMGVIYAITLPDSNRLPELLDRAVANQKITDDEAAEVENTDLVLAGDSAYALLEVSITIDRGDIQRAQERAGLLGRAIDAPVRAGVIGAHALEDAVQSSAESDVTIMLLDEE